MSWYKKSERKIDLPDYYTIEVASNPNTLPDMLADILRLGKDDDISQNAARNPNCPPEILAEILRRGKNDYVSRLAAENPNCPTEILIEILRREGDWVSNYAARNLNAPKEILVEVLRGGKDDYVSRNVARNPNTPPETLVEVLRRKNNNLVSRYAAENPNCPREMLAEILKRGKDDLVSEGAAENPNCPIEEKIKWMRATGKIGKEDSSKGHIIEYDSKELVDEDLEKLRGLVSSKKFNMSWYKKAQVSLNPLTGKSNQSARNYIYRLVGNLTKGIFKDNSWENVNAIWQRLDENSIENNIVETNYFKDEHGQPMGKTWKFEVPFTNNKGREQILNGTLTAHFAGSVQDPSDRYDISFII